MKKDKFRKMNMLEKEIEHLQMQLNQRNLETEVVTAEFE